MGRRTKTVVSFIIDLVFISTMETYYHSPEQLSDFNKMVLVLIKVRKADSPKVLSHQKVAEAIELCKQKEGLSFVPTIIG